MVDFTLGFMVGTLICALLAVAVGVIVVDANETEEEAE